MTDYRNFLHSMLVVLLGVLVTPAASSAYSDVRFRVLQTQNGLSNNDVNCIFKDSHGFVWIGTASGLNRYDGYSIKIFHSQRPDSTALRDNYVQSIQEDAKGNLWICAGDTYSIYHPSSESFSWFGKKEARALGIDSSPTKIFIDGGDKWIVGNQRSLYHCAPGKSAKKIHIPDDCNITDIKIHSQKGWSIISKDNGDISIIDKFSGNIIDRFSVGASGHGPITFSIFIDNEGLIWIYSINGIEIYNPNTKSLIAERIPSQFRNLQIKTINQDSNGTIWIGTDNHGVILLEKDGSYSLLSHSPSDIYSLPNNTVKSIYNSTDGGIWIGTYKKGVGIYYPSEYKFVNHLIADVNCIARNPQSFSEVWLGTDHSGLMKYNYNTSEPIKIKDPKASVEHPITALYTGKDGELWIGTYGGGLKRYKDGAFSHWGVDDGLASDNIWAILENGNGQIWLGTLGGGLQLFNPDNNTFRTFDLSNSDINSNYINTLALGRNGAVYVGTTEGIAIVSPTDYSIVTYKGSNRAERDFSNLNVNQIAVDSRGLIWIGTREGLEVYDINSDIIYNISLSERFPNPFILGVQEGADHSMWVTVGNEIFNVSVSQGNGPQKYEFHVNSYGSHDGIVSGTFNQRSMCLLPSGELLAGSLEGVVAINPQKITLNTNNPKVIFTGLSVKNVPIEIGKEYNGHIILKDALDYGRNVSLDYNQNDITIYFSTDLYSNTEHTVFKYRLEGLDDEWYECPSGMHHVTFTNLAPGTYTLHVIAVNADGFESSEASTLRIVVKSPWWATWWSKTIYLLLLLLVSGGIIYHFHKKSIRKLKEKQKEELSRKSEELNQMKFKFFTNISHELRTPLTLILSPVESMLKEAKDERNLRRLTTVKSNASRLLYLVNQLLDFRKNEMAGLELHLSEGDIVMAIRNACDSFNEISERKDISLEFVTDLEHLDMSFDNDKFTKILVNLLSNAVKYTPQGGRITVRLTREGDEVKVAVADTGKGISDEDKKHIFERFYRGSDKSDLNTGTGIGLSLVYEYARLHKGSVCVTDNNPKGTVFTVSIPFREDASKAIESRVKKSDTSAENAVNIQDEIKPLEQTKAKILFVDDNHDLIEFLKDEFSEQYDVVTAYNGVEALDAMKEHDFDIIVTDLMMPEMDGIEFSRRLKSDSKTVDIPLLMLTAKQDMSSIIEGLTLGADDYITKPFNNEILALKMARLIRLRRRGLKRSLIEPTPSRIEITSLDEQLVEKAVKYVEDNISRSDLSVEELAQQLGMSRVHLYKKLSALTGKSPIEFIRLLRLKRATQYLAESQLTIAEIAYKLGFNNPKYFSKYFKEEFGMLPSEYQNKS